MNRRPSGSPVPLSTWAVAAAGGLTVAAALLACGGPESFRSDRDGAFPDLRGTGGAGTAIGSGGTVPGDGSVGSGGVPSSSGGAPIGTGGRGTGGATGSGGAATGGRGGSASGGAASGGRSAGTGGATTGGRGAGGATGTGGRATGTGGARTGGRGGNTATGGMGSGGRGTGGRGTGGATPTGPCDGLCEDPVKLAPKTNSGALGTMATCHEITGMVSGIVCGNFTAPRTLSVNGTAVTCAGGNINPPPLRAGGYCMETTAGQTSSAYFTTY